MGVENEHIHDEFSVVMELSRKAKILMADLLDTIEAHSNARTEDVYDRLLSHENMVEYRNNMYERHAIFADGVVGFFTSFYDPDGTEQRLKIGYIHGWRC